jgi:diguanylate cyclase (GGDEF)-like protein/PAS domain S-box-containing protein
MKADGLGRNASRLMSQSKGLLIFVCGLFACFEAWRELAAFDATYDTARGDLMSVAQVLIENTEGNIENADVALRNVARLVVDGAYRVGPEGLGSALREQAAQLPRLRGFFVYDNYGHIVASSDRVNTTEIDNADRDYYRRHRDGIGGATSIDGLTRAKVGNLDVVQISHRFNDRDGQFAGVAVTAIEPRRFFSVYADTSATADTEIFLTLPDGRLLAQLPEAVDTTGEDEPRMADAAGRSQLDAGYFETTSIGDGRRRIVAHRSGRLYPVTVLVAGSYDGIVSAWRETAIPRIGLILGVMLITSFAGLTLFRQTKRQHDLATALAAVNERYRLVTEGSADLILQIDVERRITFASAAAREILGVAPQKLLGRTGVDALVHPAERAQIEAQVQRHLDGETSETKILHRFVHRDGHEGWIEATLRSYLAPDTHLFSGIVAVCRDVTERQATARQLAELAATDGLTGLPNRRFFDTALDQEWRRARRGGTALSLLFLDVDHFKCFNDHYGHLDGDECLRRIADVLRNRPSRAADVAARFGGEEFVVLLPETDADGATVVAEALRRTVADLSIPNQGVGPTTIVTISVGVATIEPQVSDEITPNELVAAADEAVYRAKAAGRDRVERIDLGGRICLGRSGPAQLRVVG